MAQSFSVEEIIRRPASQVWDTLTDWSNAHRWMPGIDRMESHGDTVAGTQLTFQPRGADRTTTITRCDVGRSITLRSVQGGVTADYTYEVHDLGDASRVTLVASCNFQGTWWCVIAPLLRLVIRFTDGKQLKQLKALVEGP